MQKSIHSLVYGARNCLPCGVPRCQALSAVLETAWRTEHNPSPQEAGPDRPQAIRETSNQQDTPYFTCLSTNIKKNQNKKC